MPSCFITFAERTVLRRASSTKWLVEACIVSHGQTARKHTSIHGSSIAAEMMVSRRKLTIQADRSREAACALILLYSSASRGELSIDPCRFCECTADICRIVLVGMADGHSIGNSGLHEKRLQIVDRPCEECRVLTGVL
nr:hypothetical protein CFP56_66103 [Quercus suber]